jgi:hypothetical protein
MRALGRHSRAWLGLCAGALLLLACPAALAGSSETDILLARASRWSVNFLDVFSQVKCTEQVTQEKLGKNDKVELKRQSTYDYLVILSNADGELGVDESRLAIKQVAPDPKDRSLLLTNGFATLFLVFHPYYAESFQFTPLGEEVIEGRRLSKIGFRHLPGTRSPAALALRGREYPLELSGAAWIDPETGAIAKITAEVGNTLEDVGLQSMRAEVDFAPVEFHDPKENVLFPARASVEVTTARQHWKNLHQFTNYQRFSVSTKEQVKNQ